MNRNIFGKVILELGKRLDLDNLKDLHQKTGIGKFQIVFDRDKGYPLQSRSEYSKNTRATFTRVFVSIDMTKDWELDQIIDTIVNKIANGVVAQKTNFLHEICH